MKTFRERVMELAEDAIVKAKRTGNQADRPWSLMKLKNLMRTEISVADTEVFDNSLKWFATADNAMDAWKRLLKYPQVTEPPQKITPRMLNRPGKCRCNKGAIKEWFNKIVVEGGGTAVPAVPVRKKSGPQGAAARAASLAPGETRIETVKGFSYIDKRTGKEIVRPETTRTYRGPAVASVAPAEAAMPAGLKPGPAGPVIRPAARPDNEASLRVTAHLLAGRTDAESIVALGVIYTELGMLAMRHKI